MCMNVKLYIVIYIYINYMYNVKLFIILHFYTHAERDREAKRTDRVWAIGLFLLLI